MRGVIITLLIVVGSTAFMLFTSCVYLPRCEEIHYKSVVTKDAGKVRDVLAETASPLGNNEIGYND